MLNGISPLLNADVLHALALMGHGDRIAIVDANFPAHSVAAHTVRGAPLAIGADAVAALEAVLSVLPVDRWEPERAPVQVMQVVGDPEAVPEAIAAAMPHLEGAGAQVEALERFAFYEAARGAFAVIHTLEARPYGNFIVRKGTVGF